MYDPFRPRACPGQREEAVQGVKKTGGVMKEKYSQDGYSPEYVYLLKVIMLLTRWERGHRTRHS